ncbi:MAG: hypothetical protein KO206_04355 [Methanomicrobiaceae archaeon]|uniref:Uncharacterized protein n=1 Tax=hydrocarbon metagenome TaxID=938273 RepID=A0A0W8FKA1_9ZZZZ|nr:hypothetical protein [Methanomicrobiaceae archaeon]
MHQHRLAAVLLLLSAVIAAPAVHAEPPDAASAGIRSPLKNWAHIEHLQEDTDGPIEQYATNYVRVARFEIAEPTLFAPPGERPGATFTVTWRPDTRAKWHEYLMAVAAKSEKLRLQQVIGH